MQTHHNQAGDLSLIVRDRSAGPAIRSVASDIATGQAQQAGQMDGRLSRWSLPQTSSTSSRAWTRGDQHTVSNEQSMGMATAAQIRALRRASGTEVERPFVVLMSAHHRGGVTLAHAALDLAERLQVHALSPGPLMPPSSQRSASSRGC